jgi:uracil-DNA glycosylase
MPLITGTRTGKRDPFPFIPKRVPGEGPQPAKCMLIAERPGEAESRVARPFVGISGKYLNLCLEASAIDRSTLYVTNLCKSFLHYLKPTVADIAADHDELVSEIHACSPEIIVLIGAYSVENVLARDKSELDKCHGVPIRVSELFGGELKWDGIILPMIHPASAHHSPESLPLILDDVLTLGKLLDGEIEPVIDQFVGDPDYRIVNARELSTILDEAL